MFLQRLVADEKIGFNYDHMGSSEFENGSTTTARELLARLIISGKMACKKVRLFTKWGISTYDGTEVFVFGHKDYLDRHIADPVSDRVLSDLVIRCDKENARQDDEKYLGWMKIEPYADFFDALLIVRANKDCTDRGSKFLQVFVDQILEHEEKERIANTCPSFDYEKGYNAAKVGDVFNPNASEAWQNGHNDFFRKDEDILESDQ